MLCTYAAFVAAFLLIYWLKNNHTNCNTSMISCRKQRSSKVNLSISFYSNCLRKKHRNFLDFYAEKAENVYNTVKANASKTYLMLFISISFPSKENLFIYQ